LNIKDWIKTVGKEIIDIKNKKPKDRLDYAFSISRCNMAILSSNAGWNEWLSNNGIMNEFTEEELEQIHKEFKEISVKFLLFDLRWTKVLTKRFKLTDTEDLSKYIGDDKATKETKENKDTEQNCKCDNKYIS
jgi:hypothetical protein